MKHYDLAIIGTGSGNSLIGPEHDDMRVALVERGAFGGTCLNRGCIPSKMLVYPADLAEYARHGPTLGVQTSVDGVDWPAIRQRIFGRIDAIAHDGADYRHQLDNVDVHVGSARFVGPKQIAVGDDTFTADQIVLAAGARVSLPDVPGLADTPFHTSDDVMRMPELPASMIVLGGGFVAVELGHVFGSFGTDLTIVNRSHGLLTAEDDEIARVVTDAYDARFDLRLGTDVEAVRHDGEQFHVDLRQRSDDTAVTLSAEALLVATGRVPNGDQLDLDATGVSLDDEGYVVVDRFGRTDAEGIWALGDISNPLQLKHSANAEARAVRHNLSAPDDLVAADLRFVPHAVFGHPQVGSVGANERDLIAEGVEYVAATRPYAATAFGWAMEDTTSLCKVLADPETRTLLGAHIVGPQASILVQQAVQAMYAGQTVDDLARGQLYIHPALTEVLEQALLEL